MKKLKTTLSILFVLLSTLTFGQRFTFAESENNGYFLLNGVNYQQKEYVIRYENIDPDETKINFSLVSSVDGKKIINSRKYTEVAGVSSLDELLQLLNFYSVLKNTDVLIQDQYSDAVDLYLCQLNGTTNPTFDIDANDTLITVDDSSAAVIGDCINIREGTKYFQSIVTDINDSIITIQSPCDNDFTTDAIVCFGEWNLATANGADSSLSFFSCPPPNARYDIYSITISFEDNAIMYESTFGGIAALTKGIVCRIVDGYNKQLFLVTNNAGFHEYGFDTFYPEKVPSGTYAFWARKNFKELNGVSLRIDGANNDRIEVIVSDDLTALTKLAITIHGHLVEY